MTVSRGHVLGMIFITAVQAFCFTLIKAGLDFAPPLLFAGMRGVLGGTALLLFVAFTRRPLLPPARTWPWLLALAFVGTSITFAAMFLSPGRTEAGIASTLGNLQPFVTLVFAYLLFDELLGPREIAAVGLGIGGAALVSYPSLSTAGALGISGAALALGVSFGSASANVLVKQMRLGGLLLAVTGWQLSIGGMSLLVLSGMVEDVSTVDINAELAGELLFLGLVGTALITALWFSFVQEGEMGKLSIFFYLVPVFGLAIAVAAFGEGVTLLTLAGVVLILLAVTVMAWHASAEPGRYHNPESP